MNQKKRQNLLIGILIIVAIIAIIYWYPNYKKTSLIEKSEQQTMTGLSPSEEIIEEIKLDFSILDNLLFKSLESHGILPVTAGETGNPNPFLSY